MLAWSYSYALLDRHLRKQMFIEKHGYEEQAK
jgi:hypothetical protein